jgi:hypothetical protein
METLNLLLKFKFAGESGSHMRGAARIRIDGQGGLTVYDAAAGAPERISLEQVEAIAIWPIAAGRKAA